MEYEKTGEMCNGLNIPLLEISDEDKQLEITVDRIEQIAYLTAQNPFEYSEFLCTSGTLILAGFIINRRPDLALFILQEAAEDNFSAASLYIDVFVGSDEFIDDFCKLVNLTKNTKASINQHIISIVKHYEK